MFGPGARSYWHSHPDGQVLYVATGAGRVGSADGMVAEMAAGDVIYTPAGESHWHGANPTSYMMHVSMTTGGATVWEPRAVTDEEYTHRGAYDAQGTRTPMPYRQVSRAISNMASSVERR